MSQRAREWLEACDEAKPLPAADWAVLWRLCWHYNDKDRGAWPGVSRLIAGTHLSRSTIHRCLLRLESAGWIQRHRSWRVSTFYTLPRFEARDSHGVRATTPASHGGTGVSHHDTAVSRSDDQQSHGDTQKTVPTRKEDEEQSKPLRGEMRKPRDGDPASEPQLRWLRGIYIMTNNHPPTAVEVERDAELTYAEASAAIKTRWRDLGSRDQVLSRLSKPRLLELSAAARLWLEDIEEGAMAA